MCIGYPLFEICYKIFPILKCFESSNIRIFGSEGFILAIIGDSYPKIQSKSRQSIVIFDN